MKKFIYEVLCVFTSCAILSFNGFNISTWQYWAIMICMILYRMTDAWFD